MDELFSVGGNKLDLYQKEVVLNNDKNLLVIAAAGSGKSMTIIAKINYLIKERGFCEEDILCVSFTNEVSNSLKNKLCILNYSNVEVLTFHKLALKILLKTTKKYNLIEYDVLSYLINEYFDYIILTDYTYLKITLKYFKINVCSVSKYLSLPRNRLKELKKLIHTFICILKTNGKDIYYLALLIEKEKKKINKKNTYFLYLVYKILYEYNNELKSENRIDLDDLIIKASEEIDNVSLKYKYVIIDEYQDTSFIRFNLIKKLLDKTNASFMAVGDDYQSIYAFSGCDLSLFLNFNKYFSNSKILYLPYTYRNSQELINASGKFILKDKNMKVKELKSNKSNLKPIKLVYYENPNELNKLLHYLIEKGDTNILILGRNNNDINTYTNIEDYKEYNIRYLTVHKSKGIEEDTVIIVSLIDDLYGFPCKIVNNKIFKLIENDNQYYSYYEERRLFYVALTRTRNNVYLFVNKRKPSKFINELIVKSYNYIEKIVL